MFEKILHTNGRDGYCAYRMPTLAVTRRGTLLHAIDARKDSFSDWEKSDLVVRISRNQGKDWSEPKVVVDGVAEGKSTSDFYLLSGGGEDALWLFYGFNYREFYYMNSPDGGESWSEPVDITDVILGYREEYPWVVAALGQGKGRILRDGTCLVPLWMSVSEKHKPNVSSFIYSRDGGRVWKRTGILPLPEGVECMGLNEKEFVELPDGTLYLNARVNCPGEKYRAVSWCTRDSFDWSRPMLDRSLPDPVCQGSVCYLNNGTTGGQILLSNCASQATRNNLEIKASGDGGKSWRPVRKVAEFAGYSSIHCSPDDKHIYLVHENAQRSVRPEVQGEIRFYCYDFNELLNEKE